MTPENYLQELKERLLADGCDLQWVKPGPADVMIGRRSDFKALWMATKIHLFTIAAALPEVSVTTLEQFTDFAMQTAIDHKDRLPRGIQTGLAVFPTLISDSVEPAALHSAARSQRLRFACIARPTVIDTATRTLGAYRGTPVAGIMYASYLRKKNEQYFPQPQ